MCAEGAMGFGGGANEGGGDGEQRLDGEPRRNTGVSDGDSKSQERVGMK